MNLQSYTTGPEFLQQIQAEEISVEELLADTSDSAASPAQATEFNLADEEQLARSLAGAESPGARDIDAHNRLPARGDTADDNHAARVAQYQRETWTAKSERRYRQRLAGRTPQIG